MTQREVRAIFRETNDISFEDITCRDLGVKDISLKKVKSFLREAHLSYKISKANLSSFLTSLSIYRKGKINNAGALMFASKVEKYVPMQKVFSRLSRGRIKRIFMTAMM